MSESESELREEHYPDGNVRARRHYRAHKPHGRWQVFAPDGTPREDCTYEDGILSGPARHYYDDGTLASEGSYAAEQRTGPWTLYHRTGAVESRGDFEGGRRVGSHAFFDAQGRRVEESTWSAHGNKDGPCRRYRPDGSLHEEGTCRGSSDVGIWRRYDEDEALVETIDMDEVNWRG